MNSILTKMLGWKLYELSKWSSGRIPEKKAKKPILDPDLGKWITYSHIVTWECRLSHVQWSYRTEQWNASSWNYTSMRYSGNYHYLPTWIYQSVALIWRVLRLNKLLDHRICLKFYRSLRNLSPRPTKWIFLANETSFIIKTRMQEFAECTSYFESMLRNAKRVRWMTWRVDLIWIYPKLVQLPLLRGTDNLSTSELKVQIDHWNFLHEIYLLL